MRLRLLLCIFAAVMFAPALFAQDCSTYCQPYFSCDVQCEDCLTLSTEGCLEWESVTCGTGFGGQCGGCAVTNRWTDSTTVLVSKDMTTYCMYYRYWYGWDNYSRYFRWTTRTTTTVTTETTCSGLATYDTTTSVTYGECFEFFDGTCDLNFDQLPVDQRVNGRECS